MGLADNPRLQKVVGHERIVITGLIVSDNFCAELAGSIKGEMFAQSWMRAIVECCLAYYHEYGHVPFRSMHTLFETITEELSETEAELAGTFLSSLSDDYDKTKDSFNEQFSIDEARQFIKKKSLEEMSSRVQSLLVMGKIDEAEQYALTFQDSVTTTSRGFAYSDDPSAYGYFKYQDEYDSRVVLEYPGAVGRLIGPCRRSWLVSFLAPMKRGKSNFLMESAVIGSQAGRNVFVALHEMQEDEWLDRLLANIGNGIMIGESKRMMPMFDCLSNREGTCIKPNRVNKQPYQRGQNCSYKPCNYCEHALPSDYKPCIVEVPTDFGIMDRTSAKARIAQIFPRSRIIVKKYPANTANSKTIYGDWRYLADQGDVCDIIISDYADIQGLEDKSCKDKIQAINDSWLGLKWLGDKTKSLVLTATQGKLKSLTSDDIEQDDVSGYIGKAAHVDAMIGISQTKEEKLRGVIRLTNLYHRFARCNDGTCCTVLQRLDCGKYILDSRMGKFS